MKSSKLRRALKPIFGRVLVCVSWKNEEGGKFAGQTAKGQPDAAGLEPLHADDRSTRGRRQRDGFQSVPSFSFADSSLFM